jgi:hypothetical protein
MCPNYWTEDQGSPPYDELAARRITDTIKLRANGITSITSPAVTDGAAVALLAAYLAAAATTESPGNLAEGKKRTGN